jgi:sugar O-acyltransferase (sialic acid O-acetyltransferase NeuD family)
MEKIIVIGAGGLAREVRFLIEQINVVNPQYEFLGYLVSDLKSIGEYDSKDEIIGDFNWLSKNRNVVNVAIGIGNPNHRLKVGNELSKHYQNIKFPALIHPNVVFDRKSCEIGKGVIICSSTTMTVNIKLKDYSFINLGCTIGHESIIGQGCVLNPTVNISGGVKLGDSVLIGTGSQILQYLEIGSNSILGAGACLTKSIPDNVIAVGVPAKVIKKINE